MSLQVLAALLAASLLVNLGLAALLLKSRRRLAQIEAGRAQWSIAIYEGASPLELRETNPAGAIMTARLVRDVRAEFVADPFLWRRDSRWHLFFEVKEKRRRLGSIGLATSEDGRSWQYEKIVLREPFHLSYPYVFEHDSEAFMVPECSKTGTVRLYRAKRFPDRWVFEAELLRGAPYVDSSLFQHGGRWWMFTSEPTHDILRLHTAKDLLGPWTEHPASPVVRDDAHISRPAGRVLVLDDGRILRFAQDDDPNYGRQVFAFEITRLDEGSYRESPALDRPLLAPSNYSWNKYKMHHVDAHRVAPDRWIACVDGQGYPFERRKKPPYKPAERPAAPEPVFEPARSAHT